MAGDAPDADDGREVGIVRDAEEAAERVVFSADEVVGFDHPIPDVARHRVGVRREIYARLQQASKAQGKPITELVAAALEAYLANTDS